MSHVDLTLQQVDVCFDDVLIQSSSWSMLTWINEQPSAERFLGKRGPTVRLDGCSCCVTCRELRAICGGGEVGHCVKTALSAL